MSYKLAQLFNAAYEYGGAKLLDYLQSAIGLTEVWGIAYMIELCLIFIILIALNLNKFDDNDQSYPELDSLEQLIQSGPCSS